MECDGDGFDSMNMKNADVLKVVNFSLDEPELETIVKRRLKKMIET